MLADVSGLEAAVFVFSGVTGDDVVGVDGGGVSELVAMEEKRRLAELEETDVGVRGEALHAEGERDFGYVDCE